MSENYGAICSDFYVNQRLNLKMDLPNNRETILAMFDRVRREFPNMDRFRRMEHELALESDPAADPQQWLAMRRTSVRTGVVSPVDPSAAYGFHKLILEIAPYFLSVSPLDIDYLELLYGFDLLAVGNHDAIVYDALLSGSPLGRMLDVPGAAPVDCQPVFGVALNDSSELQAHFEVKTRTPPAFSGSTREGPPDAPPEPISVYLTMRRYGAVKDISDLVTIFKQLTTRGEELLQTRVVPNLLVPIRDAISSGNA